MSNVTENSTKDEEKYKIILEHALEDYKNQDMRKQNFDTKTSYMFTFTVALIGIIVQFIDLNILCQIIGKNEIIIVIKVILIVMYIVDITLCLIAVFFYVGIINTRKYKKINTDLLKSQSQIHGNSILEIEKKLVESYTDATSYNSKQNDKVSQKYKVANILILISLCITVFLLPAIKIMGGK